MSIKKIKIVPLILCFVVFMSQTLICYAEYDATKYPVASGEYVANCFITSITSEFEYELYRTVSGSTEIVGYKELKNGVNCYRFVSLSPFTIYTYGSCKSPVYGTSGTYNKQMDSLSNGYAYYVDGSSFPLSEYTTSGSINTVHYNSMYIFDNYSSAYNYLKNGDMSGLLYNKSKTYDSDNIYLENFRVIYHDSNNFDNCYIEIKYDLPEYVVDNVSGGYCQVDITYNCDVDILSGLFDNATALDFSNSVTYDLEFYSKGFDIYLKDIVPSDNLGKGRENTMLGDEAIVDFSYFVGGECWVNVLNSDLYLNVTPIIDNTCGMQNNAQIDLLNPSNTSYYSSTPDTSGNYTTNNDYQQGDGYYTTIVGQDGQGNPTYNYYYYDNSKHYSYEIDPDTDVDIDTDIPIGGGGSSGNSDGVITILWGNALEVEGNIALDTSLGGGSSGSGGSGGDSDVDVNVGDNINLTIEDDDYTDTALREDLKDGFGLLDDSSTPEYGDGFISVASSFFNSIDPDASQILMFSLSCVCAVSILRSVFRR